MSTAETSHEESGPTDKLENERDRNVGIALERPPVSDDGGNVDGEVYGCAAKPGFLDREVGFHHTPDSLFGEV
jgi:hypothetical protein